MSRSRWKGCLGNNLKSRLTSMKQGWSWSRPEYHNDNYFCLHLDLRNEHGEEDCWGGGKMGGQKRKLGLGRVK